VSDAPEIYHLAVDIEGPTPYTSSSDADQQMLFGRVVVDLALNDPTLLEDLKQFIQPVVIKWAAIKEQQRNNAKTNE